MNIDIVIALSCAAVSATVLAFVFVKGALGAAGGARKADSKSVPSLTLVSTDLSHVEKHALNTSVGIIQLNGQLWRASIKAVDKTVPRRQMRYHVWLDPIPELKCAP